MTLDKYRELIKNAPNDAATLYVSELKQICQLETAAERDRAFRALFFQKFTTGTGHERYDVEGCHGKA